MNKIIPRITWLILWILSWLPGFILKFLSLLINAVLFAFLNYRSEVVKANLRNSFPGLSAMEQDRIAEKFCQHFSDLFLEMVMFLRLRPNPTSKRIRLTNPETLAGCLARKQNIIIMAGHYGNWEWNLLAILSAGYRVLAVYKPQTSALADQLMKNIRHKPGIVLVPMKDTFRAISRELQGNTSPFALLLVADQIPARVDIRFWTPFLNQDSAFFTGGEKLAKKFGMPVYYMDQDKKNFATYEATLAPVYDGSSPTVDGDITKIFAELLEISIRRTPYLWLWSHRRWKYQREKLPLQV